MTETQTDSVYRLKPEAMKSGMRGPLSKVILMNGGEVGLGLCLYQYIGISFPFKGSLSLVNTIVYT